MTYQNAVNYATAHSLMLEQEHYFSETQPGGVYIAENVKKPREITVRGTNNTVLIGSHADCTGASITIVGDNHLVVIGGYATIPKARIAVSGNGGTFWAGATTTTADMSAIVREGTTLHIGERSMFSNRTLIDTHDGHSIYDLETRERINPAADVWIGDHVWLGRDVRIAKGSIIGDGSIVGQSSLVLGEKCAAPNTSYAGVPARAVKSGVSWTRMTAESLDEMEQSVRHQRYLEKMSSFKKRCITT